MSQPDSNLRELLSGTMARGYPWGGLGAVDTRQEPMHGFVRGTADGLVEFEAIDSQDPFLLDEPFDRRAPAALALTTPVGGAVMLDLRPRLGMALQVGSGRESTIRATSETLLFGVDIDELTDSRIHLAQSRFRGLGSWAGLGSLNVEPTYGDDGFLEGATVTVGRGTNSSSKRSASRLLPRSLRLGLNEHWAYDGDAQGGLAITTGLQCETTSKIARPVQTHLAAAYAFQDLMAILHRGWVVSEPGRVELRGHVSDRAVLWNGSLMQMPPRAIKAPSGPGLMMSASDLGGVDGIARWVRVSREFGPAVEAVGSLYREGPESAAGLLLKVGAAIEQYVASHARESAWASKNASGSFELALAHHGGGREFEEWCGGSVKWAEQFHKTYLATKHLVGRQLPDPVRVDCFARGGRLLLMSTLLNRVSRSRNPSRRIFSSHLWDGLGRQTRSLLASVT